MLTEKVWSHSSKRRLPNETGSINMTQGSSWVTRGHRASACFTLHLKKHQQAGLVMPFWPGTSMFLLLIQSASVGVVFFLLQENKRECPRLEHCDMASLKGMRPVWLVCNNVVSSRICDSKEKRIKIENRQKRGEGRSRTRGTWVVQWWGAYEHQLKKKIKSVHMGMNRYIERYFKWERTNLTCLIKLMPTLHTPLPSQSGLLCCNHFRWEWNKIIYSGYCLLTSLFPTSTKYEGSS